MVCLCKRHSQPPVVEERLLELLLQHRIRTFDLRGAGKHLLLLELHSLELLHQYLVLFRLLLVGCKSRLASAQLGAKLIYLEAQLLDRISLSCISLLMFCEFCLQVFLAANAVGPKLAEEPLDFIARILVGLL